VGKYAGAINDTNIYLNPWSIKWTQPYATYQMRPYMRKLRDDYEVQLEAKLARGEFNDAKAVIERIMSL
jgi:hypothetical protein